MKRRAEVWAQEETGGRKKRWRNELTWWWHWRTEPACVLRSSAQCRSVPSLSPLPGQPPPTAGHWSLDGDKHRQMQSFSLVGHKNVIHFIPNPNEWSRCSKKHDCQSEYALKRFGSKHHKQQLKNCNIILKKQELNHNHDPPQHLFF